MEQVRKLILTEILESSTDSDTSDFESSEFEMEESPSDNFATNQSGLTMMKMFIDAEAKKNKRRKVIK